MFGDASDDLLYRLAVINNQNTEKSLAYAAFSSDEGVVLPYRRFSGIADMHVGDIIEIGQAGNDHRPIKYKKSVATEIDGFCKEFVGELSLPSEKPFGFIVTDEVRIFIHPGLMGLAVSMKGQSISCRALRGLDKHGKLGWRALALWSCNV